MRMISINKEPFLVVPYRFPKTGGGIQVGGFPVYGAIVEGLPPELDGLCLSCLNCKG